MIFWGKRAKLHFWMGRELHEINIIRLCHTCGTDVESSDGSREIPPGTQWDTGSVGRKRDDVMRWEGM